MCSLPQYRGCITKLATICEKNGANTTKISEDIYSITEDAEGKPDALFIEFSLLQGEHKQLLSELRDQDGCLACSLSFTHPRGLIKVSRQAGAANTFVGLPLNDAKTAELFKRAFNLPRQALLVKSQVMTLALLLKQWDTP